MSLLPRDYMISVYSFDGTWDLVAEAIRKSSSDQFSWRVEEDRDGGRITATMEYQRKLRLKRRLLLEVNFLAIGDNRIRLELSYDISPMFNIGEPERILRATRDQIAAAVAFDGKVYSSKDRLPPELSSTESLAKGETGIMRGVEIVLVFNVVVLLWEAITSPAGQAVGKSVLLLTLAWLPVGILVLLWCALAKRAEPAQPAPKRTLAQRLLFGALALGCGIAVCAIAVPIILIGLCVGALTLSSVTGR
ncbi:MAG TPA: hypothetical protein V6D08_20165 [Candidatus Obscuribacterales bacterium]